MRDELVAKLKSALGAHEEATCAYLFGSAARDELGVASDVDVAILVSDSSTPTLGSLRLGLQADLQEAVHREVDLVILNHASPDLVHRVLRDGLLLVERDRSARIRFEVNARNEYFDVLPFLRRYREAVLR